jgi:hypothetical protein
MSSSRNERISQLIALLIEKAGNDEGRTVARIASRHHLFNAAGLGTDMPGAGDTAPPTICMVGPGGRAEDEAAIELFFGIDTQLARRIMLDRPSVKIVEELSRCLPQEDAARHAVN